MVAETVFRLYVRREGRHFVGLCAELRAIVDGANVEQIVYKTNRLIEQLPSRRANSEAPHVVVYGGNEIAELDPTA